MALKKRHGRDLLKILREYHGSDAPSWGEWFTWDSEHKGPSLGKHYSRIPTRDCLANACLARDEWRIIWC